jgi:hypothetical protein
MARSKSKHIRLKNRRGTQYKQRMKRRKAEAKAGGTAAVAQKRRPARRPAVPAPPAPAAAAPASAGSPATGGQTT